MGVVFLAAPSVSVVTSGAYPKNHCLKKGGGIFPCRLPAHSCLKASYDVRFGQRRSLRSTAGTDWCYVAAMGFDPGILFTYFPWFRLFYASHNNFHHSCILLIRWVLQLRWPFPNYMRPTCPAFNRTSYKVLVSAIRALQQAFKMAPSPLHGLWRCLGLGAYRGSCQPAAFRQTGLAWVSLLKNAPTLGGKNFTLNFTDTWESLKK